MDFLEFMDLHPLHVTEEGRLYNPGLQIVLHSLVCIANNQTLGTTREKKSEAVFLVRLGMS
jgi:hypothetical protein